MKEQIVHTISPVFDNQSKILILGTIPSPKSREAGFFYSHPQNRFWKVLAALCEEEIPKTREEKTKFCLMHHIALWDVLKSCQIEGADDSSIAEPICNDLSVILKEAEIKEIFTTGTKAYALYQKYLEEKTGRRALPLPSTSPANCHHYTYEKLLEAYQVLRQYIS